MRGVRDRPDFLKHLFSLEKQEMGIVRQMWVSKTGEAWIQILVPFKCCLGPIPDIV